MKTKSKCQSYLELVNNPHFREASKAINHARNLLAAAGCDKTEVYEWIKAWGSGAGDGIE